MKKGELIAALLLCSSPIFTRAYDRICFPSRYEGQRYDVATGTTSFFAIDYVERRFLVTNNAGGDTFSIFDFGRDYLHRFQGGNCTTVHYESNDLFDRCVHNDFELPKLSLGELDHGLDVDVIGYRARNISRVTMTTEREGQILPFFEQDRHDDGTLRTSFFFRVSNSISCSNYNIYSDLSDCVHLNWSAAALQLMLKGDYVF